MTIKDEVAKINAEFYGDHTFVQTSPCGRGQHHIHGYIGVLWRINDPKTVRTGHGFMKGRLKKGDLWLGVEHSGDCFQTYMYVEEYSNCLIPKPEYTFGSYGIGDSTAVELSDEQTEALMRGKRVKK